MSSEKNQNIKHTTYWLCITAVFMVVGYSLGRAFIYSTPEYAVLKLPYQILQAGVGAVVGMLLCWKFKLVELFNKKMFKV